ncbi:hypothetical protein VKT23_013744 [Stygiomarasmius scandens]|uniref:U6 small nuclear RNA (adenine-(43)-N(6))-methyltransferase n=1 Tax=Marasmiellus scandens TaxID=2682957 RepID=A0ABR1J122_9AGAR
MRRSQSLYIFPECIRGVDIGTGASVIYPLLACSLESEWMMYASDIDELSLSYARKNIQDNHLQDRIELIDASESHDKPNKPILWPLFLHSNSSFYFTMCNPPFYGSTEEVARSAREKALEPSAVCTGADVEMITPGGERNFVLQMVRESTEVQTRCKYYTSMLGKLSSVEAVVGLLKELRISNYAVTEFAQGQTRRWAVGWSFTDIRLPDSISRTLNPNPTLQRCLPPHTTIQQPISLSIIPGTSQTDLQLKIEEVKKKLKDILGAMDLAESREDHSEFNNAGIGVSGQERSLGSCFVVRVEEDTWSRSARRKHKQQQQSQVDQMAVDDFARESEQEPLVKAGIISTIHLNNEAQEGKEPKGILVEFQWRRGREDDKNRRLFESFCSHVSRKVLPQTGGQPTK